MARVRMLETTYHPEVGPQRLPAGLALDVEDEMARRWVKNRIAEPWNGPTGQVDDDVARASLDELDAQIARLEEVRQARQAYQEAQMVGNAPPPTDAPATTAAAYQTGEDPLARYNLSEQQRVNLQRAGFTRPEIIDAATLEDLQEVDGIGPATLARLRPDLAQQK